MLGDFWYIVKSGEESFVSFGVDWSGAGGEAVTFLACCRTRVRLMYFGV